MLLIGVTDPEYYSGGGEKTVAKLVILEKYLDAYLNIIPRYFDQWWYVGTHAGTGFSNEFGVNIPGSALRALEKDFQRYYFYEKNTDHWELLCDTVEAELDIGLFRGERDDGTLVATADDPYIRIMNQDCNSGATWLAREASSYAHWFTFVDPEKFSATLDLMETLRRRGTMDILLNFQTEGYFRNGSEDAEHAHDAVTSNLGEGWPRDRSHDEYVEYYKQTVFEEYGWNARSRKMVSEGSNKWRYDLIFASENDTADRIIGDIFDTPRLKSEITTEISEHRGQKSGGQQSIGQITVSSHSEDDEGGNAQSGLGDFI